jgi:hypothetical protein
VGIKIKLVNIPEYVFQVRSPLASRLEKFYGNSTPLEIESPTLPLARFNLPDLWPAHLPASPSLPAASLHNPTGTDCQRGTPDITISIDPASIESTISYRIKKRLIA